MSIRVVFPAPFGPTTPSAWPRGTARLMPFSTTVGVHQASDDRFLPSGPSAFTTLGNRSALAMAAILGLYPTWLHCFQNVRKSGGSGHPKTISTPRALYLLMTEVKSVVPSG
jgi:hypothetical protein